MTISGDRLLSLGRELADRIEGEALSEQRRADAIRRECDSSLSQRLTEIWSDPDLWRTRGGVQVLDTSKQGLIARARRQSFEAIDRDYLTMGAGILPRQARKADA